MNVINVTNLNTNIYDLISEGFNKGIHLFFFDIDIFVRLKIKKLIKGKIEDLVYEGFLSSLIYNYGVYEIYIAEKDMSVHFKDIIENYDDIKFILHDDFSVSIYCFKDDRYEKVISAEIDFYKLEKIEKF